MPSYKDDVVDFVDFEFDFVVVGVVDVFSQTEFQFVVEW